MTGMAALELSQIPMSQALAGTLARAADGARATGAAEITLEHVLAALCDDPDARDVLNASHIDAGSLRAETIAYLARAAGAPAHARSGDVAVSAAVKRILEAAAAAARGGRRRDINGAIVLAAIVGDGRSIAAQILQSRGMTFDGAIRALQAAMAQPSRENGYPGAPAEDVLARARERVQSRAAPTLREIMQDLPGAAAKRANTFPLPTDIIPAPAMPELPPQPPEAAAIPAPAPKAKPQSEIATASEPTLEAEIASVQVKTGQEKPAPVPVEATPAVAAPPQPEIATAPAPEPAKAPTETGPASPSLAGSSAPAIGEPADITPEAPPVKPESADAGAVPLNVPSPPPQPVQAEPERASAPMPPPIPPPIPRMAPAPAPSGHAMGGPQTMPRGAPLTPPPMPPPMPSNFPATLPPHMPPAMPAGMARRTGFPGQPPPATMQSVPMQPVPAGPAPKPAARAQPPRPMQPQPSPVRQREAASKAELGQLSENVPRTMRVGVSERVEIRIARGRLKSLTEGMEGGGLAWRHDVVVTKAMSVRLRAPEGGFFIETASPETQWVDSQFADVGDDFASWRFLITPNRHGVSRLQIVVSARTVGADGLAAETAFPDQVIEVKIKANLKRALLRWSGWIVAAVLGGLLSKFGEGAYETGSSLISRFIH